VTSTAAKPSVRGKGPLRRKRGRRHRDGRRVSRRVTVRVAASGDSTPRRHRLPNVRILPSRRPHDSRLARVRLTAC